MSADITASVLMIAYTHYKSDPRVMRAAEAAVEAGFRVDVVVLRREGELPVEMVRGVRIIRAQHRYRGDSRLRYLLAYIQFFLRCFFTLTHLFRSNRYKVVHVHNMPDVLVFAAVIPKLLGAKVILDIHDPMPETYGTKFGSGQRSMTGWMLLLLERWSVAFADVTITVSEPLREGVLLKHGYRPETIHVIANFADDEIFRLMAYPAIHEKIRFVFHGTILERYGLRTLMDAVTRLRHRHKVTVRIIGEGDFSNELGEIIRSRSLGDTVEFLNHMYPLHEIPSLLEDCHVGIVPLDIHTSRVANYALPLKLVEYTCLGIPSITVRNEAIEHYLRADECMFFDSGDAHQLARWIDRVAGDPNGLQVYRKKIEIARKRLLWSLEKEKYIAMVRRLGEGRAVSG